jgi:hypothetical protein
MARISRDLQQSLGGGAKQQAVKQTLVAQCEWRQLLGHGEDHMDVGYSPGSTKWSFCSLSVIAQTIAYHHQVRSPRTILLAPQHPQTFVVRQSVASTERREVSDHQPSWDA